jgi:HEPN domain-containing protein
MKLVQAAKLATGVAKLESARARTRTLRAISVVLHQTIDKTVPLVVDQLRSQLAAHNVGVDFHYTPSGDELPDRWVGDFRPAIIADIDGAGRELEEAALPTRFGEKLARIRKMVLNDPLDANTVCVLLDELALDVLAELREPIFLHVSHEKRALYEQREFPFGAEVAAAFPDATRDIAAAARCLALDEWTACVFHSMRVLEHGLRSLAQRFGVPFAQDSWHKVIEGVETGIEALRNKPGLTEKDRAAITALSEAATQFRYFKDAWRNHVAHAREHYDERDAERVFSHVRDFMQHMVKMKAL